MRWEALTNNYDCMSFVLMFSNELCEIWINFASVSFFLMNCEILLKGSDQFLLRNHENRSFIQSFLNFWCFLMTSVKYSLAPREKHIVWRVSIFKKVSDKRPPKHINKSIYEKIFVSKRVQDFVLAQMIRIVLIKKTYVLISFVRSNVIKLHWMTPDDI